MQNAVSNPPQGLGDITQHIVLLQQPYRIGL